VENKEHFDIGVIGGGPAGITAAINAAKCGRSVCLIDRKEIAGYPVRCGEAIGLNGFTSSISLKGEWIKSKIVSMKLVSPSGIPVIVPSDYEGYVIDRQKMESDLIKDAEALGALYVPSTSILSVVSSGGGEYACKSKDRTFFARCVILAEGVESRLARSLGWETSLELSDIESCAFCRVAHETIEPETTDFYLGSDIAPGGYAWVFPRGKGTANVGLGVLGTRCSGGMPKDLLLSFVKEHFPGASVSELHCAGVPVGKWIKPLVKDGVMLVGDAARMMNCVSGAGIAYALYSGKIAGTAAGTSFRDGVCDWSSLRDYEKKWASFYGRQQIRSFKLKEVMVGFPDEFLDSIAQSVSKADPNKVSVISIFFKAFSKHPLLLLKVMKLLR
jgi:digeranylgeranylglycerophospholipid reductase